MRNNQAQVPGDDSSLQIGSLLVAHPAMQDPNFSRTVVFLAAHDSSEGSLGLILNRALDRTLGESDATFAGTKLGALRLYNGGPVAKDQLIFAAWKWEESTATFQLMFGIDRIRAEQLLVENSGFEVRAFLGHAGWSEGQLDEELVQKAWLVSRCLTELMTKGGEQVWRDILLRENPTLRLILDAPEDPWLN